jgi:hypothetical protein
LPLIPDRPIDVAALFGPQWLNQYVDAAGVWRRGQERAIVSTETLPFGTGAEIEILEVGCSGGATLSGIGATLAASGGLEVFLTVAFNDGRSEYRSAPSSAPYRLSNVQQLSLSTLCVVGNDACEEVFYAIVANAHCQWRFA